MRTPVVVELDPVADHPDRVLLALEAIAVCTLLLQRADDTLDHAVLLRAMRRDELLTRRASVVARHNPANNKARSAGLVRDE